MLLDARGNPVSSVQESDTFEKQITAPRDYSKYGEWSWGVSPQQVGRISYQLLRFLYRTSSSVRPAVDGITREIAGLTWKIIYKDLKYHPRSDTEVLLNFFKQPNQDKETFAILISKFINDLLVIGKGCIEKVRNPLGQVIELVARDAARYHPLLDDSGALQAYREFLPNSYQRREDHDPNNIIFRYFSPTTFGIDGMPIMETIINEIATLLLSVKAIGWIFTNDELPPGLLHLGTIGEAALERARASFEAQRGLIGSTKIRVVDNVDEVNWVQLTRPFREMQVAELMPIIERIIARNFGLSPVETGLSDVARGSAEISIRAAQSKLILPLTILIQEALNNEIINELNSDVEFQFVQAPQETHQARAESFYTLWKSALLTPNEARLRLGYDAVPGGDIRTVLLGNEIVPIGDDGMPMYRNPPGAPPSAQHAVPNPSLAVTEEDFREAFGLPLEKDTSHGSHRRNSPSR